MKGYFNKYLFEYYLAYASKRGVPRHVGKLSRDLLQECFEQADPSEQIEQVFTRAISLLQVRLFVKARAAARAQARQPLPDSPMHSVSAKESIDAYTEFVYDPPSARPVDTQMRSSFGVRMLGIDWDYYLQRE